MKNYVQILSDTKGREDKLSELQHNCKRLKTDIAQLTEMLRRCMIRVNQHAVFPL